MIDSSYLLGLYGGSGASSSTYASLTGGTKKAQPTAPWSTTAVNVQPADERVRAALAGRKVISEDAIRLDVSGASADYRKLFALYQGLDTLTALTNRAATKNISTSEQALLTKRFAAGMSELSTYMSGLDLDGVRLVQGTTTSVSKTTAAVAKDSAISVTAAVHEGSLDQEVAAFQGDVKFNMTVKVPQGLGTNTTTLGIDLSEMGSTPRTLDNVTTFINGKLEAGGFQTRMGREKLPAEAKTVTVNGKPVTLPAGADRWALAIRATSTETIGFQPVDASDAVYVTQGAGTAGGFQLLKFQADGGAADAPTEGRVGETQWVDGRVSQSSLPAGLSAVRASATAADGSLWVVGDLKTGSSTQPIKGEADVALMHYDSAGRLIASRTLGAASSASGYALAVADDGRVAVAGSVTGALNTSTTDAGRTGDAAGVADSFVTVFNADGEEQWTQRRGARAADEATAVSFGADGKVYVAGRAKSAMTGAAAVGGWDGYVQAFTASEPYPTAGIRASSLGVTQFGTGADDNVRAMTVDGSNLYTVGVEDGHAVVRQFSLTGGAPTLVSSRDLGEISGDVTGVAVANGKVIVSGTTRNTALDAGTVTNAHAGGTDAFVASLDAGLAPSSADRLTYFGGAGDDTAADVKVANGKVWITGVSDRAIGAKDTDATRGYLARIDPTSGAVEYQKTWAGDGDQARPATLAVASGGASVLDRLGLPAGEIDQSDSKLLTAATSLRVGDRFYVSPADGGRSTAVTIEAKDTLATLAKKIERASLGKLKVTVATTGATTTGKDGETVTTTGGFQNLSIMARDGKTGAVLTSGEPGRDALEGLGLSSGYIGMASSTDKDSLKTFGLGLPRDLDLSSAASIKAAGEALQKAMTAVRNAYRALAPTNALASASGTVPTYLSNQISNYQAALSRLTGGA